MEIILYNINKKVNSFREAGGGRYKYGNILEPCSITNPVIELELDSVSYNYVWITQFNRYYFVENIVIQSGNLYRLYLKVDVLASFKSQIMGQTIFIERWSNSGVDNLFDEKCVAKSNPEIQIGTGRLPLDKAGSFVIGVIGKNGGTGVTYYSITQGQLENLMFFLFTPENFTDVLANETMKAFLNPFQYIVSLMWFPFSAQTTNVVNINFGWFPSNVQGGKLTGNNFTSGELWVKIPRKYGKGDFRNVKYAKYTLYIPFIGEISIPSSEVANYDWISYKFSVDIPTGRTQCHIGVTNSIESGQGTVIKRVEGQMGCPLAIAQTSTNVVGGALQVMSGVLSGASNPVTALTGLANGVIDGISELAPKADIKSGNGCRSVIDFEPDVKLTAILYEANVLNPNENGYVHCKYATLASLGSGFAKGDATSVQVNCLKEEKEEINTLIQGGVYLE